jgi:CRISPR/Cas system-associated exonuclease Cas4 (RecB family)
MLFFMNKKITTIDDLAVMMGKESSVNEKRFGVLEERFDVLESNVTAIKETMATKRDVHRVEARILAAIGDISVEVKNHNKRILALEKIITP